MPIVITLRIMDSDLGTSSWKIWGKFGWYMYEKIIIGNALRIARPSILNVSAAETRL